MGDDVDHAAVQQADPGNGEGGGRAVSVRAVGIEEERRRAIPLHALLVDHRERHLHTVPGRGPEALGGVLGLVIAAQHLGLFQQGLLPRAHVAVVDARGRHHGLVGEAEGLRGVFGRSSGESRVDALGEGHVLPAAGLHVEDAEVRQSLALLDHHQKVAEGLDAFKQDIRPVGDEGLPMLGIRRRVRRGDQAEILGVLVGADVEGLRAVLHVVFVALLPGQQHLEGGFRRRSGQVPRLPGIRGLTFHQDIRAVLGAPHPDAEEFIFLREDRLGLSALQV